MRQWRSGVFIVVNFEHTSRFKQVIAGATNATNILKNLQ